MRAAVTGAGGPEVSRLRKPQVVAGAPSGQASLRSVSGTCAAAAALATADWPPCGSESAPWSSMVLQRAMTFDARGAAEAATTVA